MTGKNTQYTGEADMKKNGNEIEKEQLFSFETAEEFFPQQRAQASSAQHENRLKAESQTFSKKHKIKKNEENKS